MSGVKSSMPISFMRLDSISLSNWYLSMRVYLISGQHIMSMAGHFRVSMPPNKATLFVDGGEDLIFCVDQSDQLVTGTLLPALTMEGVIWLKIVKGSFDAAHFTDFINSLLTQMNDFPQPHSIVVMDNCHIHKGEHIKSMIKAR